MVELIRPMSLAPKPTQRELVTLALRKLEWKGAGEVSREECVAIATELRTLRRALLQCSELMEAALKDEINADALDEAIVLARGLALVGR